MMGLIVICILIGSSLFTAKRLLRYLRYLQQEDYSSSRLMTWIWNSKAIDKRGSLIALCSAICALAWPLTAAILSMLGWILFASIEEDPRKAGKLRLKMTDRAKRLFFTALGIYALAFLCVAWLCFPNPPYLILSQVILFQCTPLLLITASYILSWDESRRQKKFLIEAKQILSQVSPFVIGITGSYGKTSTKDALARIMQIALGPTFWPAKGVNTPMGITREIRSGLRKGMRYAVIEMGAYGRGSIKRICDLTPPHAAIITCIGTAHLERFGSEQTILETKAELAQAVPADGILVCNGDNPGARRIAQEHKKKTTLLYGFDKDCGHLDCWITHFQTTVQGTFFTLEWKGKTYNGFTPLFGKPAISNVAGAFTMACALGSQPEFVIAAIHNLSPVDNRLQVQQDNGVTYLKDAYNSNPTGFAAALSVMSELPGQRRIVMTPGMIELGTLQHKEHEQIGRAAAQVCNLALIVGDTNKSSLTKGLIDGGMHADNIVYCPTRENAFAHLNKVKRHGDIILIENDLVDLYEAVESF